MARTLDAMGWIYLFLSIIASIIIWVNSTYQNPAYEYVEDIITSWAMIGYGFAVLIQGFMFFFIFLALAEILNKLDGKNSS